MAGELIVISGPMYSEKTKKLFELTTDEAIIFEPSTKNKVEVERGNERRTLVGINKEYPQDIENHVTKESEVGVRKAHMFDEGLVEVCNSLIGDGKNVYISALDTDFRGEPFVVTSKLLALSDKVIKKTSKCSMCGEEATRSQRFIDGEPADKDDELILRGYDEYAPVCKDCHRID